MNKNPPTNGFKKGKSGNPGGRPKGLMQMVLAKTKRGEKLVNMALDIMEGKYESTARDRLAALSWLADRAFGKVQDVQAVSNPDGSNIIPQEIIEAAAKIARSL